MIHEHNSYLCSAWNNSLLRVFRSLARLTIVTQWTYFWKQPEHHKWMNGLCVREKCFHFYPMHIFPMWAFTAVTSHFRRISVNKRQNQSANKNQMDGIDVGGTVTIKVIRRVEWMKGKIGEHNSFALSTIWLWFVCVGKRNAKWNSSYKFDCC